MSSGYAIWPQADRDLDGIVEYLSQAASVDTALRFLTAAHETFTLIAGRREMGWPCRLRHPDLMSARVFRVSAPFEKYLIFYRPYPDGIGILRVLHSAQDIESLLFEA